MSTPRLADRDDLRLAVERARGFSGWSFETLDVRPLDGPLPWDYEARARELAATAGRTIDLGTGGGEVLSRIAEGSPGRFVTTEEWHVNARVAADRLRPGRHSSCPRIE